MTHSDLQSWLDRYVRAWRANNAESIEELFTEDVVYRWHPYDEGDEIAEGRDAVVAAWLEDPDDPESWEAIYQAFAVDDDRAVGIGTSRYLATSEEPERVYHNCFLMKFAEDGRCSEFTEYFMKE